MIMSARTFLKSLIAVVTSLFGGTARAEQNAPRDSQGPQTSSEKLTMSDFLARVRNDSKLRERFAENPRAVLREHGIDPTPYNLPDRVSDAQMEHLLAELSRPTRPRRPPPPDLGRAPPTVVYGPPPGPPQRP